jgi:large subunit ribosomal protein L24e
MSEFICAFSGDPIEPGTGLMYVKRNGEVLHYKTRKCLKEHQKLGRINRYVKWTKAARDLKAERKA